MKIERLKLARNDTRNMASSDPFLVTTGQAVWSDLTVTQATKEGFASNSWVYRAVSLISRTAASVPWTVFDSDGEPITGHPLAAVLARPNPEMSRQDFFELLVAWLQLTGAAFAYRSMGASGVTLELWPLSPDRIAPWPSKDPSKLIDGYEVVSEQGARSGKISTEYTVDNVVHFKLLDPANPINGISPLRAAGRAVDTDNAQTDWNKAGMDNRGVFDGLFSFAETLAPEQAITMAQRIKEKFMGIKNARKPLVLGTDAKYQRISVSPAEMDFLESRKFNREEIMSIFGVPLQLVGSEESATYNNFAESLRIFWMTTIIPLLDDMADTFNLAFGDELPDGARVGYDTSSVAAMRAAEDAKVALAERYWKMGVPLAAINNKLELGLDEFAGWDKPFSGAKPAAVSDKGEARARIWRLSHSRRLQREYRSRDALAEGPVQESFLKLLREQRARVFKALDDGVTNEAAIAAIVNADNEQWMVDMLESSMAVATDAADSVTVSTDGRSIALRSHPDACEQRDEYDDAATTLIEEYLGVEGWMLTDLSHLQTTTVNGIIDQLRNGLDEGMTIPQIQQAIDDVGLFGPERSLMLARTLAGTAASIGQISGAVLSGATEKEWTTAGFETRAAHSAREGERVGINDRFSDQGYGAPRYPLDPNLEPGDRCNCRCSMLFHE